MRVQALLAYWFLTLSGMQELGDQCKVVFARYCGKNCTERKEKQSVSMFRLNRNKQKTHANSLKESILGYFSKNLGLFWFVSVCYETDLYVSVVST